MQKWGMILFLLGLGLFFLFGGVSFIAFLLSPEAPVVVKIAFLLVAVGTFLLILAVVKQTWGKKDKYDEVDK